MSTAVSSRTGAPVDRDLRANEVTLSVQDFIRLSARRGPSDRSIVLEDGTTFTYEETNNRINRLADVLASEGVGSGSRVALMGVDSHRYLETCLAILKLGATMVPFNFRLARRELDTLVAKAQPEMLFFSGRYAQMLEGIDSEHPSLRQLVCFDGPSPGATDYEELIARGLEREPAVPRPHLSDIAALAFTSGTTGLPKGVQQSYGMLTRIILHNTIDYDARPDDFWYTSSPLFHVAGFAYPMMSVALGATNLILPQFDAETVLRFIDSDLGLTAVFLVPTMISSILSLPEARTAKWESLRLICYGSAPMPPALLREAMELIGCDFINTFGAGTEAGSQTVLNAADHRRAAEGHPELLGSIGRPAIGVELRICDENWNDVPQGHVGEIVTRSSTVMSGYLDMPEETARVFGEGGWFRGGDLGYISEDGYVYLKGRSKDMIIRGGENIYPVEIEAVLAEHPDIEIASVVGVEDAHWGQTVRAWVLLRPEAGEVTPGDLRDFCAANLARYKLPNEFYFVDELPRNASGKILKRELVNWDPAEKAAGGGKA